MSNLRGESKDILQENVEQLKQLFPEVCCEEKIDFDKLKQILGEYVDDDRERYNFSWNGKGRSLRLSQTPSLGTLRPCKEESKDWDSTQNLYIEGDNLEVLKLLQKSYYGKVKMIYIDPPYNTGSDFVYKDDFSDSIDNYKEITGQIDFHGISNSTNAEYNGRFHTDWLNMIYPRLKLARNLLSNSGAIFISIDDNEVFNLKKICNEIFGESCFVATFPWRKRSAKSDVPFGISQDYEWVICYAKSKSFAASVKGKDRRYYESPDFPGDSWRLHDMTKQTTASERPNSFFTMVNPRNGDMYECDPNKTWRITKDTFKDYYDKGRIVFPGDYDFLNINKPVMRYFKSQDMEKDGDNFGRVAMSTKFPDDVGMSQDGTKSMKNIFDNVVFPFPKPVKLIRYCIEATSNNDDIILDFFSGSATTAHAVMQLNAEDGGNRRFIMVQLPEVCGEKTEAYKAGYKNICEIGKERIRRAGEKIKVQIEEENAQLKIDDEPKKVPDIGFRVFKLDSSNLKKWQPDYDDLEKTLLDSIENYVEGRSELDVVYEIILKMGLDLTYPVDELDVNGRKIYSVAFGALMICLDDHITKEIADGMISLYQEYQPELWKVVFKDNGFENDSAKTNIKEQLKAAGLEEDAFTTI